MITDSFGQNSLEWALKPLPTLMPHLSLPQPHLMNDKNAVHIFL